MVDPRFAGNAQRRRMGAASSHLSMVDQPDSDNNAANMVKNHYIDPTSSPAAMSESNGHGPEMADFNQDVKNLEVTNDQQFSRPPAR